MTWLSGGTAMLSRLASLQKDMLEVPPEPGMRASRLDEFWERFVDIREAMQHIGEDDEDEDEDEIEAEKEFDPRG